MNFLRNNSESMKHWIIKAIIFKILRELKRTVGVEYEVHGAIVDVIDMDESIAYEIESHINERKVLRRLRKLSNLHDVFIIDARKVPNDFAGAEKYLRKIIV